MDFVAGGVAFEFRDPEFAAVCRCGAIFAAAVAMPEAAVNEDDGFVFGKNDVGTTGEVFAVETKAVTHAVKERSDEDLGLCVFALDSRHVPRPPLFRKAIFAQRLFHLGN